MKVWEYMSAGRPILYSNLEIIREVLEERGTFFQPDNAADFAKAVLSMYRDKETTERIATQNPKEVQAYTWDARAAHILDFIQAKSITQ